MFWMFICCMAQFIFYTYINKIILDPVDCKWSAWTWGTCSVTCGGGTQSGTRTKTQQASNGGTACTGGDTTTRSCNTETCPGSLQQNVLKHYCTPMRPVPQERDINIDAKLSILGSQPPPRKGHLWQC